MKKMTIPAALAAGLLIGTVAVTHAKLPAPPPKSDAEKAAEAEKAAAAKAKDAELLNRYQEKAVANYKKNKGMAEEAKPAPASQSGKK
ncbi:MAG TPA: hypothetical protein VFX67_09310 [Burkholderiales bacterium]|nr:hypothetical protein [Burkholderiales bacterium]